MNLIDFLNEVRIKAAQDTSQRFGQVLFNHLHNLRPDLANELRGTDMDPFYRDFPSASCLDWLRRMW